VVADTHSGMSVTIFNMFHWLFSDVDTGGGHIDIRASVWASSIGRGDGGEEVADMHLECLWPFFLAHSVCQPVTSMLGEVMLVSGHLSGHSVTAF
jgi:hypothetical protein